MNAGTNFKNGGSDSRRWYELFSRGAKDWLRHNEKVREAVREQLPQLISQADILGDDGNRRVQVPVRFLEHYRFKLGSAENQRGAGQGDAEPGDVLRQARDTKQGQGKGAGGNEGGGIDFVLELTVNDIVDWLWEELDLPNLRAKSGSIEQDDYTREGWDRRGARSRLDRRRSLKESIKRRAVQKEGPAFADDDLRFRQLVKRERPAYEAVVFFVMDVSASMGQRDRQMAKTFFFWALQGLRRQYTHINCVFIAHTDKAWEFNEKEFFEVSGSGGTVASSAFDAVLRKIETGFDASRYNIYMFYASDGENFPQDRDGALERLTTIGDLANYMGFVETVTTAGSKASTEMAMLFKGLEHNEMPVGIHYLHEEKDIWDAIRAFFHQQAAEQE